MIALFQTAESNIVEKEDLLPVCLEIDLVKPEEEDFFAPRRRSSYNRRGRTKIIRPQALPTRYTNVRSYVDQILPGLSVEHIGREKMLHLHDVNSSSLFFQAVHECFANHYPLALRPEVFMQLIIHEIATTVKMNADHYRGLFTTS